MPQARSLPGRATRCSTASTVRSDCGRRSPRSQSGRRSRSRTRSRLIVGRRPRHGRGGARARSSRSTPSTPRSPSACAAGARDEVRRLVLTASGGPFRGRTRDAAGRRHPRARRCAHPTWDMGPMVTTNSATLVNKGLEVIEAHLLFDVPLRPHRRRRASAVDRALDGRVHRRLDDRAGLAAGHAAADRARAGLAGPGRRRRRRPLDWTPAPTWTFEPLDDEAFPAVGAGQAGRTRGGTLPGRLQRAPTSRRSTRSTPAGSASSTSSTPIERVVDAHLERSRASLEPIAGSSLSAFVADRLRTD